MFLGFAEDLLPKAALCGARGASREKRIELHVATRVLGCIRPMKMKGKALVRFSTCPELIYFRRRKLNCDGLFDRVLLCCLQLLCFNRLPFVCDIFFTVFAMIVGNMASRARRGVYCWWKRRCALVTQYECLPSRIIITQLSVAVCVSTS